MATKVCLVGRRHLFRAGLSFILDRDLFEIALEVEDLHDVQDVAWRSVLFIVDSPDDVRSIEDDIRRLKALPSAHRVVMLVAAMDQSHMVDCFSAGVDGYLLERISPEALNESLRLVMIGESVFPSQLVALLCDRPVGIRSPPLRSHADCALSERETEVVARLATGMPNKVIASDLTIAEATVKVHLKSILKKLGVSNRTQAAVWAINNGHAQAPEIVF